MPHYKALKHTIRGKAGSLIEVHGNDIKTLQRLGVIGAKAHTAKAEHEAPAAPVDVAALEQRAVELAAQVAELKDKKKSAAKAEKELADVQEQLAAALVAQG